MDSISKRVHQIQKQTPSHQSSVPSFGLDYRRRTQQRRNSDHSINPEYHTATMILPNRPVSPAKCIRAPFISKKSPTIQPPPDRSNENSENSSSGPVGSFRVHSADRRNFSGEHFPRRKSSDPENGFGVFNQSTMVEKTAAYVPAPQRRMRLKNMVRPDSMFLPETNQPTEMYNDRSVNDRIRNLEQSVYETQIGADFNSDQANLLKQPVDWNEVAHRMQHGTNTTSTTAAATTNMTSQQQQPMQPPHPMQYTPLTQLSPSTNCMSFTATNTLPQPMTQQSRIQSNFPAYVVISDSNLSPQYATMATTSPAGMSNVSPALAGPLLGLFGQPSNYLYTTQPQAQTSMVSTMAAPAYYTQTQFAGQPLSMLTNQGFVQPQVTILATDPATLRAILSGGLGNQQMLQPLMWPQTMMTPTTSTTVLEPRVESSRLDFSVGAVEPSVAVMSQMMNPQRDQNHHLRKASTTPVQEHITMVDRSQVERFPQSTLQEPMNAPSRVTVSYSPTDVPQQMSVHQPPPPTEEHHAEIIIQNRHSTSELPVRKPTPPSVEHETPLPQVIGHPPRTLRFLQNPPVCESTAQTEDQRNQLTKLPTYREPKKLNPPTTFVERKSQVDDFDVNRESPRPSVEAWGTYDADTLDRRQDPNSISAYYERIKQRGPRPLSVYRPNRGAEATSQKTDSNMIRSTSSTTRHIQAVKPRREHQQTIEKPRPTSLLRRAVTFNESPSPQFEQQQEEVNLIPGGPTVSKDASVMTVAERARQWLEGCDRDRYDRYRYSTCGFIDQDLIDCQELIPVEDRVKMFDSGVTEVTTDGIEMPPDQAQSSVPQSIVPVVRSELSKPFVMEPVRQDTKIMPPSRAVASMRLQSTKPSVTHRAPVGLQHLKLASVDSTDPLKRRRQNMRPFTKTTDPVSPTHVDDFSRMSIGEKLRLFNRVSQPPKTSQNRLVQRRRTQPVTLDDLARANEIILARLDGRSLESPISTLLGEDGESFGFQEQVSKISTPEASLLAASRVSSEANPCPLNLEDAVTFPHRSPAISITRATSKENRPAPSLNRTKSHATKPTSTSIASALAVTTQVIALPLLHESALKDFFHSEPLEGEGYVDDVQIMSSILQPNTQLQDDYQRIALARRAVRPERRRKTATPNPLKTLAQRTDLRSEYEEVRCTSAIQRPRSKSPQHRLLRAIDPCDRITNQIAQHRSTLAEAAIAALGTKEDISDAKSNLRQTTEDLAATLSPIQRQMLPYKHPMLLQIKGRRHVHVRLVCPDVRSMSPDDCFILVTPSDVFAWFGSCANVIETSKARELASWIVKHHDLGFRSLEVDDYVTVHEKQEYVTEDHLEVSDASTIKFWNALGYNEVPVVQDHLEAHEDELYELLMQHTNRVYQVTADELVPCSKYWGNSIKHELLQHDQAFVFDFGSEVYLWTGTLVSPEIRAAGIELVQQVYHGPYDYTQCRVNPLNPMLSHCDIPVERDTRPTWTLLGRVTSRGETVLFKEKFIDWPDFQRAGIGLQRKKTRHDSGIASVVSAYATVEPYSADALYDVVFNEPPPLPDLLTLDGRFVGRGGDGCLREDGIIRRFRVETDSLCVWHVSEYHRCELPPRNHGQFHQGNTYVIRWAFRVIHVGLRDIPKSRGNDQVQYAYFFWQGSVSRITEKGAAALMAVEMDEERGPQIRVTEGKEPPAFCRLFNGRMIIHSGKRTSQVSSLNPVDSQPKVRLFIVRGEVPAEGCLLEVPPHLSSLRSQGHLLLLQYATNNTSDRTVEKAWLWSGRWTPKSSLVIARHMVQQLYENCPTELASELPKVNEVQQTEDKIGPDEMLLQLTTTEEKEEDSSLSSLCVNFHRGYGPLVIWHVSSTISQQMSVRRLSYPMHPDADSLSSLQASIEKDGVTTATPSSVHSNTSLSSTSTIVNESPLEMAKLIATRLQRSASTASKLARNGDQYLALPFLLKDLYNAPQPAIFLVVSGTKAVYVWQGWWPKRGHSRNDYSLQSSVLSNTSSADDVLTSPGDVSIDEMSCSTSPNSPILSEDSNLHTGSAPGRFHSLRRAVLHTADQLAQRIGVDAMVVYAGLEPPEFLAIFPPFNHDCETFSRFQHEEEKTNHQRDSASDLLQAHGSTSYTLTELQHRPLPAELDATCLEIYLSPDEFQSAFNMSKDDFDQLPIWKRGELKRRLNLF